jgi:hypothetical protein
MKWYYEAHTKRGTPKTGSVEAHTQGAAAMALRKQGLFATKLEPKPIKHLLYAGREEVREEVPERTAVDPDRPLNLRLGGEEEEVPEEILSALSDEPEEVVCPGEPEEPDEPEQEPPPEAWRVALKAEVMSMDEVVNSFKDMGVALDTKELRWHLLCSAADRAVLNRSVSRLAARPSREPEGVADSEEVPATRPLRVPRDGGDAPKRVSSIEGRF